MGRTVTKPIEYAPEGRTTWLANSLFWCLGCMIIISTLSLGNLFLLQTASLARNRTHEVIEQIDAIERATERSASWYQSYQTSRNPADLQRSDRELAIAQSGLAALRRVEADNSDHPKAAGDLITQLKKKVSEPSVLQATSQSFVEGVAHLISMREQERDRLVRRGAEVRNVELMTMTLIVGTLLFSIVSLVFLRKRWKQENRWTRAMFQRLHAAEARFLAFMNHSPLPAFITDTDSKLVFSNAAWNRAMGTEINAETGAYLSRDIPAQLSKRDADVLKSGSTLEFSEKVPTVGNRLSDWLVVRFPFSSDGDSQLLGGIALDITESIATQNALRASEERLRMALLSGNMRVWEVGIPEDYTRHDIGELRVVDDGAAWSLTVNENLQLMDPGCRDQVRTSLEHALATRGSYQVTYRTLGERWMVSSGTVLLDELGRPRRIVGFRQDQTEKIEAERSLEKLIKLHESILKSTHTALISINKDRIVTSWNPAAEKLLGYTAREVVGKTSPDLWHEPEGRDAEARQLGVRGHLNADPFLSQALLRGEITYESIFRRKDGTRIPVRLTITPILNEDGSLFGFLKHATDISELRRANHQVEELSQALQDTVSGWAKLDLDGRYVAASKSYAETVGFTAEQLIGRAWQDTIAPEDLPYVTGVYENFRLTGRGKARARGLRRDGSIFYQELCLAPARDAAETPIGCYWFMQNVTARVEAEQKLEVSERRYRELFELSPLPCWLYDPQTLHFLDVNDAAVRHYGYSRDEFLNMSVTALRLPEEAELIEHELRRFNRQPSWTSGPWKNKVRGGALIEVEIATRDLSENARLAVIRDVTEQRQAELIRKSEAQLQEAQQIARLGSWELDTRSGAVTWSPETYRIFGLNGTQGKFRYDEFLGLVHPDDRKAVAAAVASSLEDQARYDLQFRIVRQDGQTRHIHGRGQFSNGSRQCLAGTMLDITEQKRAQDELQQSLEEKELLLKEVHHRVKNNLQVISCLLNMQAGYIANEAAVEGLRESERRVMAMAAIHERLYGHKRLDRIDFCEYAQTLTEDLVVSYASKGAQIEPHYSLESIELNIEQAIPCGLILNELITNALKYAYPDGERGRIFITLQQTADQRLALTVADHGRGLPENFNWNKTKSLGATIINLLTRQLRGHLDIQSPGSGAVFTVVFPKAS